MTDAAELIGEGSLYPFPINWRDGYKLSLEYRTDIFTSRAGKEQRRALRQTPRTQLGFTSTLAAEKLQEFDRFVYRNQTRQVAVHDFSRSLSIAEWLSSTQFKVTATPDWLAPGEALGFADSVALIDTVTGDTVTLSTPVTVGGERAHPLLFAQLPTSLPVRYSTDSVAEAEMSFSGLAGRHPWDYGEPEDVFNGREVLPFEPNWGSSIGATFEHERDEIDFGFGRTISYNPVAFGTRIYQVRFTLGTTDEAYRMMQFFGRMRGQRGEFYVPSPATDLTVLSELGPDSATVLLGGADVYDTYRNDTVHQALCFEVDGYPNRLYRKIISLEKVGAATRATLNQPFPVEAPIGTATVRWLRATRFAVDLLTVDGRTDSVAETDIAIKSLENLSPDGALWSELSEGADWLISYFGWIFTKNVIIPSIFRFVHIEYPRTGAVSVFNSGAFWINKWYGQPYATAEVTNPLHLLIHSKLPAILQE